MLVKSFSTEVCQSIFLLQQVGPCVLVSSEGLDTKLTNQNLIGRARVEGKREGGCSLNRDSNLQPLNPEFSILTTWPHHHHVSKLLGEKQYCILIIAVFDRQVMQVKTYHIKLAKTSGVHMVTCSDTTSVTADECTCNLALAGLDPWSLLLPSSSCHPFFVRMKVCWRLAAFSEFLVPAWFRSMLPASCTKIPISLY